MSRHLVIPDLQIRPGDDLTFLSAIANYIVEKKPDVIVQIGDFADMPSLSSYDVGKKSFEGRRYISDVEIAVQAQQILLEPIQQEVIRLKHNKKKAWNPRLVLTLGNHEDRIARATNNDSKLDGTIGIHDLKYQEFGWEVHDFLRPVVIDGVAYCHYYPSGVYGRPITTANAMVSKLHMSSVCGHQQGRQVAYGRRADGKRITCIMAGSCYEHNEDYMDYQSNKHWRGVILLNEVVDGEFDEMFVSLSYLRKKYG